MKECFLNIFISVHVTETGRCIKMTIEKSLKLQILASCFHKIPSTISKNYVTGTLAVRFTTFYSSPPTINLKNQFLLLPNSNATKTGQIHIFKNTITKSVFRRYLRYIVTKPGSHIHLYQRFVFADAVLKQHKDCEMIFLLSSTIL